MLLTPCRLLPRNIHDRLGVMLSSLRYDITIVIAAVWCSPLVELAWFVRPIFDNKFWMGSISGANKHRSIARLSYFMTQQNEKSWGDRVSLYGPMGSHRIYGFSQKCFDTLEKFGNTSDSADRAKSLCLVWNGMNLTSDYSSGMQYII